MAQREGEPQIEGDAPQNPENPNEIQVKSQNAPGNPGVQGVPVNPGPHNPKEIKAHPQNDQGNAESEGALVNPGPQGAPVSPGSNQPGAPRGVQDDNEDWKSNLRVGSNIDVMDLEGIWIPAKILNLTLQEGKPDKFYVSYYNWGDRWNETIPSSSSRIAAYGTHKWNYRFPKGFENSPDFKNSPYAHLSKDQKPLPRQRDDIDESSFRQKAQLKQTVGPKIKMSLKSENKLRSYRMEMNEADDARNIQQVIDETRIEADLDDTRNYLWALHVSEKGDAKVEADPPKQNQQLNEGKDVNRFRSDIDFDPHQNEDYDEKSDPWFIRIAIKKNRLDYMEQFLKTKYKHDKDATARCLVWAAQYDNMDAVKLLIGRYHPPINVQALPLFYAIRNMNPDLCDAILDYMEFRKKKHGDSYNSMHRCFREVTQRDMIDVGKRILQFYHPTDRDIQMALSASTEFSLIIEERYCARDGMFDVDWNDDIEGVDVDDFDWGDEEDIENKLADVDVDGMEEKHQSIDGPQSPKKQYMVYELGYEVNTDSLRNIANDLGLLDNLQFDKEENIAYFADTPRQLETELCERLYDKKSEPVDVMKKLLEGLQSTLKKKFDGGDYTNATSLQTRINQIRTKILESSDQKDGQEKWKIHIISEDLKDEMEEKHSK